MRAPTPRPDEGDAHERRAIALVLSGHFPPPLSEPTADQNEWDQCISWRRMLVGLQWAKDRESTTKLVWAFLAAVRERGENAALHRAERAAKATAEIGLYKACALAIDALRPSKSREEAEAMLCALFRLRHPKAPGGFSTVGHR
jgi:hypothetical protein